MVTGSGGGGSNTTATRKQRRQQGLQRNNDIRSTTAMSNFCGLLLMSVGSGSQVIVLRYFSHCYPAPRGEPSLFPFFSHFSCMTRPQSVCVGFTGNGTSYISKCMMCKITTIATGKNLSFRNDGRGLNALNDRS